MKRLLAGFCWTVLSLGMPHAFSQAVVPNVGPAMAPPSIAPAGIHMQFDNVSEVYRFIVQTRRLGNPNDEALVRALAAASTIRQVKDISGDSLTVIKPELLADGRSRVASNGNYPYYLCRVTAQGLVLLGTMFGQSYAMSLVDGHLQFTLRLRTTAGAVHRMRFQVRGDALVNLSPIRQQTDPYIAAL